MGSRFSLPPSFLPHPLRIVREESGPLCVISIFLRIVKKVSRPSNDLVKLIKAAYTCFKTEEKRANLN